MRWFLAAVLLVSGLNTALAGPLDGQKTVYLAGANGERISVATVRFYTEAEAARYTIDWSDAPFTDQFLSMRPFKCLTGPAKFWCRVPYPYEIRRTVSPTDLTDLEYDLLFVWKEAGDYGINMWNGVYYTIGIDGDRLVGTLNEIDMGKLAVPPPTSELRPVGAGDIEEGDPDNHWLPRVVIE